MLSIRGEGVADKTYREDDAAESFKDENWRDKVVEWILVDGLHTHRHKLFRLRLCTYVSHIKPHHVPWLTRSFKN